MFSRHVSARLPQYCDGVLSPGDVQAVETHVARCARCRQQLAEIRFVSRMVLQLSVVQAPASVWNRIDVELSEPPATSPWRLAPRWVVAYAVVIVAAAGAHLALRDATPSWEVTTLTDGGGSTRMAAGELVETGEQSRARIVVGSLGTVDVEPGTRVRLGEAGDTQYRLALERGTISAQISAPPRLFIVDTPASAVVDLGCAYTVTVAGDGMGVLRMTEGWAALEWKGRESLVPAGAICRTRPSVGPGIPYFEDASEALRRAVDAFDFEGGGASSVEIILREARVRDTLTLWHLLSRVDAAQRAQVYDRTAALVPPPASVVRESVLALDRGALRLWREEMAWKW